MLWAEMLFVFKKNENKYKHLLVSIEIPNIVHKIQKFIFLFYNAWIVCSCNITLEKLLFKNRDQHLL